MPVDFQPHRPHHLRRALLPPLLALLLSACASVPPAPRPALDLPTAWPGQAAIQHAPNPQTPTEVGVSEKTAAQNWWAVFADPQLDALISEGLAHNADLSLAVARMAEAEALAGLADARRQPNLAASLGSSRQQHSQRGATALPDGTARTQNNHQYGLEISYELDLWGRLRQASNAARAELLASTANRDALQLSLSTRLAASHFGLAASNAQAQMAREALMLRQQRLYLLEQQRAAGRLADFDLQSARAEVADARRQVLALSERIEQQETALALLLGRSPRAVLSTGAARTGDLAASLQAMTAQVPAPPLPAGLPSELLLRRPDLVAAEQQLHATEARIAAARAEYFPSIGLTALLGGESVALSSLFTGPAGIFRLAAAASQPLWNAGRIEQQVAAAEARRNQALATYQQRIAQAFGEVRLALAAQRTSDGRVLAADERASALEAAWQQAEARLAAGLISRLDAMLLEQQWLAAQFERADARLAQQLARLDLIKALGGGWTGLAARAADPAAAGA